VLTLLILRFSTLIKLILGLSNSVTDLISAVVVLLRRDINGLAAEASEVLELVNL